MTKQYPIHEKVIALDEQYKNRDQQAIKNSTLLDASRISQDLYLPLFLTEYFSNNKRIRNFLEVGSSVGNLTLPIRSFVDRVFSFDICQGAIDISKETNQGIPGIEVFQADGLSPLNSNAIASHLFDFIYIREFHPFTRNFFASLDEAKAIQKEALLAYSSRLEENGLMVIYQVNTVDQAFRPSPEMIPTDCKLELAYYDPRLLSPFIQLFRRNLKLACFFTKLFQPLLRLRGYPTYLFVLRKKAS